jgi:hypothetical protein
MYISGAECKIWVIWAHFCSFPEKIPATLDCHFPKKTFPVTLDCHFTPKNISGDNGLVPVIVVLVGGSGPHEGNVYATNPETGIFGAVCDDYWDQPDVRAISNLKL